MTLKSRNTWKWIGIGVGAIGGGGTVLAILVFALNAYITNAVKDSIAKELTKVPTIETVTSQHVVLNDGISDNFTSIGKLEMSQDEFRLLFIEYLQKESER